MSRLNQRLLSIFLVVIIATTLASNGAIRAVAQTVQNVFVTNTAARAVNTIVRNAAAAPVWTRDVNEARQPIQRQTDIIFTSSSNSHFANIYTVPAGKRLVIEYISGTGYVPTDHGIIWAGVATFSDGDYAAHRINPEWRGHYGSRQHYTAAQTTRIYAEPGTTVQALAEPSTGTSTGIFILAFTGYLVNVP